MASEAARAADAPSPAATAPAPWDTGEPAAAAAAAGADVLADEAPAYDMRFDSPGDFFDVRVSVHISFWVADAESACSVRPLPACLSGLLRLHRDEVCACAGHDARWAPASAAASPGGRAHGGAAAGVRRLLCQPGCTPDRAPCSSPAGPAPARRRAVTGAASPAPYAMLPGASCGVSGAIASVAMPCAVRTLVKRLG